MKYLGLLYRLILLTLLWGAVALPQAHARSVTFAVIGQTDPDGMNAQSLAQALHSLQDQRIQFVVVQGMKSRYEPCTDEMFESRQALLAGALHPIVLVPGASDWVNCTHEDGQSNSSERLEKLREVFYGANLPPPGERFVRQSAQARFRSYQENMRWESQGVMFATINLPASNNHYLAAAGRNGEFEDRLVANRDWMQRVFDSARSLRLSAIVLFCDADPRLFLGNRNRNRSSQSRDGYLEFRQQLRQMSEKFQGRVVLVHNRTEAANSEGLHWQGNLGELVVGPGLRKVRVDTRGNVEVPGRAGRKRAAQTRQ